MKNFIKYTIALTACYFFYTSRILAANTTCMGVFPDVDNGNTFCAYTEYLYYQKVLSGDKNDDYKFKPDNNLTRGQLAKIIKIAFAIPTNSGDADFPDVSKTHTFYSDIKSLKNAGIISGNSKGQFEADSNVTRGAMMKFIINAAKYTKNQSISKSSTDLSKIFPDMPVTHTFYNETRDIYSLSQSISDKSLRIISGYSDGKFYPDNNVTRGQASKMIANTMKLTNIQNIQCKESYCQELFTGPIIPIKNIYNDGKIRIEFPDTWAKSETLTKFLFAYEFNSGVQSIVGERTSLNYILELTDARCKDLGKEIETQLSSDSSTFDDVALQATELLEISDKNVCKIALKNKKGNIQIIQNIYILVINDNEVYQIVTTSGSGSPVNESIIKGMQILV